MSAPIGWENTATGLLPLDPSEGVVSATERIPDHPGAHSPPPEFSVISLIPVVPSALVHVSVTFSASAPAKSAGGVTASDWMSAVCTVQELSLRRVPPSNIQPERRPLTVTEIRPLGCGEGSLRARLMGSPAVPAGFTWVLVISVGRLVPPLVSVTPTRSDQDIVCAIWSGARLAP